MNAKSVKMATEKQINIDANEIAALIKQGKEAEALDLFKQKIKPLNHWEAIALRVEVWKRVEGVEG